MGLRLVVLHRLWTLQPLNSSLVCRKSTVFLRQASRARKCGMSLSEHALVRRYANDVKGAPIPVKTEEDVFKALGLEYKAPEERDI